MARRAAVIEGLAEIPVQGFSINNFGVETAETGISCANVVGMTFDNVLINAEKGPAMAVSDVREIEIYRFATHKPERDQPVLRFENVNDGLIQSCAAAEGTGTFLELKGGANRDISLMANRLSRASREVDFVEGALEAALVRKS